jgi:predicted peroxiredoxin
MAVDDKVVIGQTHGLDDPESVLIGYLMGVEALRKGKQVVMWLTKDGINVATSGFAANVEVPGAPSVLDLHKEYMERGGRFFACPVCVKTRGLEDAEWVETAEVKGAPSVYEFADGGALTFNY